MSTIISRREKQLLASLFFLFGVGIMATSPRTPEIKANLHLNNGTFGTFLSLGAIGSLLALIFMGDVVHKYGVRPVLIGSTIGMYGSIALVPHFHTGWIWLIDNFVIGFVLSCFHISINAQAIHRQEQSGQVLIPVFHGMWSSGALTTAIIAVVITGRVSLAIHIDTLMALCLGISLYAIHALRPTLMGPAPYDDEHPKTSLKSVLGAFTFQPVVIFAMLMALQLEFANNDWATIYSTESLGMGASISILTYLIFVIAMISVRFTVPKLFAIRPERFWMRWNPIIGGIGFIFFMLVGISVSHHNKVEGFVITLIAFAMGGLGCSFIVPGLFAIAARRSSLPGGVVVALLGVSNTVLTFIMKVVIAWVAQAVNLTAALMIPAVMLMATSTVAHLGSDKKLVKE